MNELSYGLKKQVDLSFDDADQRVRELLQVEGFGILTEIDVRETLRNKLDVEHRPYRILGACNPPLAHQALQAEIDVGLLLPCNVIVYEGDTPDTSVVAILDPRTQLAAAGNPALDELGRDVMERMERVLGAL